jgi:hypothetical protein
MSLFLLALFLALGNVKEYIDLKFCMLPLFLAHVMHYIATTELYYVIATLFCFNYVFDSKHLQASLILTSGYTNRVTNGTLSCVKYLNVTFLTNSNFIITFTCLL